EYMRRLAWEESHRCPYPNIALGICQDDAARAPLPLSPYMRERRLRLGEPEGHVHSAVEVDGRSQGGTRLCPPTSLRIQGAETPVAVGHEWTHTEFLSQGQGLLVVGFGLHNIGEGGVGIDNAKLVQRVRLVGTLFVLPGQVERLARVLPGLLATSRQ